MRSEQSIVFVGARYKHGRIHEKYWSTYIPVGLMGHSPRLEQAPSACDPFRFSTNRITRQANCYVVPIGRYTCEAGQAIATGAIFSRPLQKVRQNSIVTPGYLGGYIVLTYCMLVFVLRVPGEGVSRRRVDGGRLSCFGCGKQIPKQQ